MLKLIIIDEKLSHMLISYCDSGNIIHALRIFYIFTHFILKLRCYLYYYLSAVVIPIPLNSDSFSKNTNISPLHSVIDFNFNV
jgi:hypothetical protein